MTALPRAKVPQRRDAPNRSIELRRRVYSPAVIGILRTQAVDACDVAFPVHKRPQLGFL